MAPSPDNAVAKGMDPGAIEKLLALAPEKGRALLRLSTSPDSPLEPNRRANA